MKRINNIVFLLLISLFINLLGCSNSNIEGNLDNNKNNNVINEIGSESNIEANDKNNDELIEEVGEKKNIDNGDNDDNQKFSLNIDIEKVKPNECGLIMVLMYHSIGELEGEWSRTPDNFRKDLQNLYDKGYRPISLNDYVSGNIIVDAGYTPVVITFDDAWQNNFNMIKDTNDEWIIDPDSAVGILEKFHEEHEDFPLEATFFVNANPFEQEEFIKYKLQYIVDKGMDIGNHTYTHIDFTNADKEQIQEELSKVIGMTKEFIPEYEVNTLALPFGSRPENKELYSYLERGEFNDINYANKAILNVGWDPNRSPYHIKFNPLAIHRVRASELKQYVDDVGMYDWIERFENGTRTKFVSDGNPNVITIPEGFMEVLNEKATEGKKVITY